VIAPFTTGTVRLSPKTVAVSLLLRPETVSVVDSGDALASAGFAIISVKRAAKTHVCVPSSETEASTRVPMVEAVAFVV